MRQSQRLVEAPQIVNQILAQADSHCLLAFVDAAGQHHVNHARLANQVSHADGGAAAGENAALAFRQRKICGLIGNSNMGSGRQLQPAADNCAFERGNDWQAVIFHLIKRLMPGEADAHEFSCITVLLVMFHKV